MAFEIHKLLDKQKAIAIVAVQKSCRIREAFRALFRTEQDIFLLKAMNGGEITGSKRRRVLIKELFIIEIAVRLFNRKRGRRQRQKSLDDEGYAYVIPRVHGKYRDGEPK